MQIDKNRADLTELVRRENGAVLYQGSEGTIARKEDDGAVITDILDGQRLCALLDGLKLPKLELLTVKSRETADELAQHFHWNGRNPCSQWVYCRPEPPEQMSCDIRPLTQAYAAVAAEHYHLIDDSLSYLTARIAAGRMWGLFEDGRLAGFIGMHSEGSMGMLEILPEYRRKGYGYALEAFLIAWHLQQGWTPYCHVIDGNEASLHLQKKLGLEQAEMPAIWVFE